MMLVFILLLLQLEIIFSSNIECQNTPLLSNKNCFNNILIFNNKKYRAGHFAINKRGDLLIEFSEEDSDTNSFSSRLFYGLRKDGSYFFPEGNHIYELNITGAKDNIKDNNGEYYYGRYESKNLFISLNNNLENENEYFFSVSTYKSVVELYDFNDIKNISYYTWTPKNFFDLENKYYIYSYQFSLFEMKNNYIYILVFYPGISNDNQVDGTTNKYMIKKFKFLSFNNDNSREILNSVESDFYLTNRIISSFEMDYYNIIIVIYTKSLNEYYYYYFGIYNYDLEYRKDIDNLSVEQQIYNLDIGKGLFFKPIYIKDNYFSFIYFKDGNNGNSLALIIYQLEQNNTEYYLTSKLKYDQFNISFKPDTSLNDFVKIDETRLAFISTENDNEQRKLDFLLFDLYDKYTKMKVRIYSYNIGNYEFNKELSCSLYNDYLIFSATSIDKTDNNNNNLFSLFMLLGYPNGTDSTLDISSFFINGDNYDPNFNFTHFLYNNLTIDNNIFGYIPDNKIKLISIPDEILIYKENENEKIHIQNNSDLFILDKYILQQNKNISKTSQYYYIYYQYIIREPNYQEFYDNSQNSIEYTQNKTHDFEKEFIPKSFYGKINKLKFKLCHEYCETCYEISISNDNQKCESCLSLYKYDYWYYLNKDKLNNYNIINNCVPEGFYYDKENEALTLCNLTDYKYYYNQVDNKMICFSNKYDCPEMFPTYNETTKECLNISLPNDLITESTSFIFFSTQNFETSELNMKQSTSRVIETTYQENIETTNILKIIETSFPENIINSNYFCDYLTLKSDGCNFENTTIEHIYEKIINNIISSFPNGGESVFINTENNYTFQITTFNNELDCLNGNKKCNSSVLDFKGCTDLLKIKNNIEPDIDLIVLKYESLSNKPNEKSVQYEVYHPDSNEKLNLSICSNINIDLYVPIQLSEETKQLYDDLNSKGYNLFDKNDKFYTDICTPYKSQNGTDIPLADRYNDFYNSNQLNCQANCQYSDYNSESQYLKCECSIVNNEKIETENPQKVTAVSIFKTFYTILKYSNYKVIKCYKLIFRPVTFYKNKGSILTMIYFLGYFCSFFLYIYNNIIYLVKEIFKLFNQKNDKSSISKNIKELEVNNNNINNNEIQIIDNNKIKNNNNYKNKILKKRKRKTMNNNLLPKNIKIEKRKSAISNDNNNIIKERKKYFKNPPIKNKLSLLKMDTINKSNKDKKSKINNLNNKNKNIDSKRSLIINRKSFSESKKFIDKLVVKKLEPKDYIDNNTEKKEKEDLDDLEYNDLDYLEALEKDNRNFMRVYFSLLKREHIIIFTFLTCNDYNIFSIKLSKFFFLICTDMALNVFFFSDESMHNIYQNEGKFNFFDQLVQMIYSTIVSQLLQIFLNYLTMTDIHYYQIKEIRNEIKSNYKVLKIIKCIKIKLVVFYVFTFLLFLFYWYIISSFCAVYENTQIIFLTDSISSFIMGLIYPFILYLVPTGLRFISFIPKKKKNLKFFYWLSDIIPFF